MGIIQNFLGNLELRNLARAVVVRRESTPKPVYSNWSLRRAVHEGYKSNSWVYRSIFLKSQAAGAVRWVVKNEEGEVLDGHPVNKLLSSPNPYISRQDMFELIALWMELAGTANLLKAKGLGATNELWPLSPDRLHPVPTKDPLKWLEGYALDKSKTVTYQPEEVVQFKYMNPADPLLGISPLEVLAKTVDVDNDQRDFNKATSQNRGVVDGVFMFKRRFKAQKDADAVRDSINERHGGKRTFGVLGDEASYVRTALTPAEMDFINSRRANREEIFICFGVPPVYAGVVDGATMNNYKTSELIFWFGTMLFFLDNLRDTLNFSFKDELKGARIDYDISGIPAIREAMLAKTKTAKTLHEMGVPFEQLNKVFEFGFDAYGGWDLSMPGGSTTSGEEITNDSTTRGSDVVLERPRGPMEFRANVDVEKAVEKETRANKKVFVDLFDTQFEAVIDALDKSIDADVAAVIDETSNLWVERLYEMYTRTAVSHGLDFSVEVRSTEEQVQAAIEEYLEGEAIILNEVSMINATTVEKLLAQVRSAQENGDSMSTLQQAIMDTGIFDEKRALGLARTISGNAINLGQWKGAAASGATKKRWSASDFEVRSTHKKADGTVVGINDYFIVGGKKARFPLDNDLPPKERMNCRCTLTYIVE